MKSNEDIINEKKRLIELGRILLIEDSDCYELTKINAKIDIINWIIEND